MADLHHSAGHLSHSPFSPSMVHSHRYVRPQVWKPYWSAQQRFFKLMCVSIKVWVLALRWPGIFCKIMSATCSQQHNNCFCCKEALQLLGTSQIMSQLYALVLQQGRDGRLSRSASQPRHASNCMSSICTAFQECHALPCDACSSLAVNQDSG